MARVNKKTINISKLKDRLSSYIRQVNETQTELVVTDHERPVAKLIPFASTEDELAVVPAKRSPAFLVEQSKLKPGAKDHKSLDALLEERGKR